MHRRLWLLAGAAVAVLLLAASATARTTGSATVHAASLKAAPFAQSWAQTPRTVAGRKAKDVVVIAVTAATSFFVGQQLGERSGGGQLAATTVLSSSARLDPGLIAMLQRGVFRARADRRVVAI